jgi:hypothetical protein
MQHRVDCSHRYIDPRSGREVLPFVNVMAEPGRTAAMTLGRRYVCASCRKIIDLRARGRLALPEAPIDTRTMDVPFIDWTELDEQPRGSAYGQRRTASRSERQRAAAL